MLLMLAMLVMAGRFERRHWQVLALHHEAARTVSASARQAKRGRGLSTVRC